MTYQKDKVKLKFTKIRKTSTNRKAFAKVEVTVLRTNRSTTHPLPLKGY